MDSFAKKFIEEATDNINDLENALLELDRNPDDKEIIERIFRALHSLKGGGAMFGFETISTITHELEEIYDDIRKGKKEISDDITSLTLETADHLRNLLADPNLENEDLQTIHLQLTGRIQNLLESNPDSTSTSLTTENTPKEQTKTFYIHFQPNEDILQNGTNPLYLIDELCEYGENIVVPNYSYLLEATDFNPEKCYVQWEIYLESNVDEDTLKDVFLFVEDSSLIDIKTIAKGNLLKDDVITDTIAKIRNESQDLTFSAISKILQERNADKVKKSSNLNKKEQKITSVRINSDKLDDLMNMVSELVTTQARLSLYAEKDADAVLTTIAENIQKLTRQLRDIAFSIVLIPIDTIVMRFQRLVRDLSKSLYKNIELVTKGTDTELDKSLIETLVDPLMHIIRNSIDHGIEPIDERRKAGKPETGTIKLHAYYSGVNVVIDITDDGRGINKDNIFRKGVEKGLVAPDEKLTDNEIYLLIFEPGFSTAQTVTDVSGRGVGMDVVKKKINEVRGEVYVKSEVGVGTTISIVIPITLSIIDGLLVRIDNHHFILPMVVVDKIYSIKHNEIGKSANDIIVLGNQQVPYIHLRSDFNIGGEAPEYEEVVVASYNEKQVGLVIDSVVGEYQAVLKPLGKQFKDQDYLSGASILGDGRIALVLDTNKMIREIDKKQREKRSLIVS